MRDLIRKLNLETSQAVFAGPYLTEEEKIRFEDDYRTMNEGFLSLPIYLPRTSLWNAVRARERIVDTLSAGMKISRARLYSLR